MIRQSFEAFVDDLAALARVEACDGGDEHTYAADPALGLPLLARHYWEARFGGYFAAAAGRLAEGQRPALGGFDGAARFVTAFVACDPHGPRGRDFGPDHFTIFDGDTRLRPVDGLPGVAAPASAVDQQAIDDPEAYLRAIFGDPTGG